MEVCCRPLFWNLGSSCHQTGQPLSRRRFKGSFRPSTRYTESRFLRLPALIELTTCFFGWRMIASLTSIGPGAEKRSGHHGHPTISIPAWMHGENTSCSPIIPTLNARYRSHITEKSLGSFADSRPIMVSNESSVVSLFQSKVPKFVRGWSLESISQSLAVESGNVPTCFLLL